MIGKANWFSPRKYGGWGLTPNCRQGWLYILFAALPVILITYLPLSLVLKNIIIYSWTALFVLDLIDILLHLKKDEREALHEAIADRNALWVILLVLAIALIYQTYTQSVDYFIIAALGIGTIIKALTHLHLRHR